MRFFRHLLVQRLVVLLVGAGVATGVAEVVQAHPAERYAGWLRQQAKGEARALVDAALRRTVLPPEPTPGEFLAGYAAAQHHLTVAPTGALFGYDDLTFAQALGRLETRMAGFGAPAPSAAFTAVPLAVPVTMHTAPALLPLRAAPTRTAAFAAPRHVQPPEGQRAPLLHGVSAAQPMGP